MENIAVIMTAYNEMPEHLRSSIESIINQTYRDLHIYLLLDAPDNEELDAVCREYAGRDDRITYIVNEKNLGLVASLNRLLGMIDENYVARMDGDDIAEPDRIRREMEFMSDENLDFVTGEIDYIKGDRIEPGLNLPDLTGQDFAEAQGMMNLSAHPTWLLKREVYEALSGYRNMNYCEDLDFILRALQYGYRIGRLGQVVLHYRLREDGISSSFAYEQDMKSRLLLDEYRKNLPVDDISVEDINRRYGAKEQDESSRYRCSKSRLDGDVKLLGDKKLVRAGLNILIHMFTDRYYRMILSDILRNKKALAKLYSKSGK